MFEINLIRERVVPKFLFIKRTVIAGSVIGFMALVAIIIAFLGFKLQPDIDNQDLAIKSAEKTRTELLKIVAEVTLVDEDRKKAQEAKAKLARLWRAPMHMGVLYELMELLGNDYKGDAGYLKTDVAVRQLWFDATKNDARARIVLQLRNKQDVPKVQDYVKRLLGDKADPKAVGGEIAKRGGFGPPEQPIAGTSVKPAGGPDLVDPPALDSNSDGRFVVIDIPAEAPDFYEAYLANAN